MSIEEIKRVVLIAIASDDELFGCLVLKGGNAIRLYNPTFERPSLDLDYSMSGAFAEDRLPEIQGRIETCLARQFGDRGYRVFDVQLEPRPTIVSEDLRPFWGGYFVSFKIVEEHVAVEVNDNPSHMRRRATPLNQNHGTKFTIDISAHEYCDHKQRVSVDDVSLYVYSLDAIVCEKLRAICQQDPDYARIIHRTRPATPRARDFYDICRIVEANPVDLARKDTQSLLTSIFGAKRVPLSLLGRIGDLRELHRDDFSSVTDTLSRPPDRSFDEYVDSVVRLVQPAEPLWKV